MATSPIKIIAIALIVSTVIVAAWTVTSAATKNNTYKQLEKAAASQVFAGKLGDPKRSSIECYPDGRSSTCLALMYIVSADDCRDIAISLSGTGKEGEGCRFTRNNRMYKDIHVTYITGKTSDGTYRLTVSKSSN